MLKSYYSSYTASTSAYMCVSFRTQIFLSSMHFYISLWMEIFCFIYFNWDRRQHSWLLIPLSSPSIRVITPPFLHHGTNSKTLPFLFLNHILFSNYLMSTIFSSTVTNSHYFLPLRTVTYCVFLPFPQAVPMWIKPWRSYVRHPHCRWYHRMLKS